MSDSDFGRKRKQIQCDKLKNARSRIGSVNENNVPGGRRKNNDDVRHKRGKSTEEGSCDACSNCRRSHITLHKFVVSKKINRKFCLMTTEKNSIVWLCDECEVVCLQSKNKIALEQFAWPSFVWDVLSDKNPNNSRLMWKMLPEKWRYWWKKSMMNFIGDNEDLDPVCYVKDVTTDRYRCDYSLRKENMKDISWSTFVGVFEELCCIPSVRCPYGCSEYLHKAERFEFDGFVQHYVSRKVKCYSSKFNRGLSAMGYGFRDDLFSCICEILEGGPDHNTFQCMPCVRMVNNVP